MVSGPRWARLARVGDRGAREGLSSRLHVGARPGGATLSSREKPEIRVLCPSSRFLNIGDQLEFFLLTLCGPKKTHLWATVEVGGGQVWAGVLRGPPWSWR